MHAKKLGKHLGDMEEQRDLAAGKTGAEIVAQTAEVVDVREQTGVASSRALQMDVGPLPVPTPSKEDLKKKKKPKNETYPPELEPYKLQLEKWVEDRRSMMAFFMDRDDQEFEIVYGDWFWYKPGKKNKICVGVLAYKQALDRYKDELAEGLLTVEDIMFTLFHELAHMKTTREGDRAGLNFILDHFAKYLPGKKIESNDVSGKKIALYGTYISFYNILEDCIVNRMVLNTQWYAEARLQDSVKGLYVGPFFELYRKSKSGGHHEEIDKLTKKVKIVKVKPGTGELQALTAEDYRKGFSSEELYRRPNKEGKVEMNLAGDFLTYFIKSQMGVMPVDAFYDGKEFPKAANSRYEVENVLAACFNEKIPKLYERLLGAVVKKYSGDKKKMSRYLKFMAWPVKVKTYKVENKKVVEGEPIIYYNVIPPGTEANVGNGDLFLANNLFKQALTKLSLAGVEKMTLPQLFQEFKRLQSGRGKGNTIPFVHTFAERTHLIRRVIEPIFTLLCLLDDSFDLKLPEQTMEHGEGDSEGENGGEGGEGDDDEEEQDMDPNTYFSEGREVEVDDPGNPNHGKRGVISKVTRNGDEVIAVEVDYFEEQEKVGMATAINGRDVELTGEKEEFTDFLKKLIVITKQSKDKGKGKTPKNPDKIKTKPLKKEKEEGEKPEKKPGDGGEKQDGGEDDAPDAPDAPPDLPKEIKDFADQVREALEEKEKEQNRENLEEALDSLDYQGKREKQNEKAKLKKALGKKSEKPKKSRKLARGGLPVQSPPELTEAQINSSIDEMQELEEMLRPYMDAMAREWLKVVENVAAEVHSFKDRFYREGKINIKKLQKYFPEIEYGQDVNDRLIKEKIIERLVLDLKPKMLRLHLLIDNSGSMAGLLPSVKMALMLLYGSMSSLRNLFIRQMQETLGLSMAEAEDRFGLMTDVRLSLFGETSRTIKPFDFEDLSFLEPGRFDEKPQPTSIDVERIEMLKAFVAINAMEGTNDSTFWPRILAEYSANQQLQQALKNNALTDVLVQISDGDIANSAEDVKDIADELKENYKLKIGGFAIGSNYEAAVLALAKRHGLSNVISAQTPEEIVRNFADFLTRVVKEQVEKPYIEAIKISAEQVAEEDDDDAP